MSKQEETPGLSSDFSKRTSEQEGQESRVLPGAHIEAEEIKAANVVSGTQHIAEQHIHLTGQYHAPPLHLPLRAEHFQDRMTEQTWLLAHLHTGRIVTICGPGGMGKTALVAEVLWTLTPDQHPPAAFPDGLLFYSFYGQPQVTVALEQIARAFGEEPVPTPALAAQRALSGRRILLVLDGAEQANQLEQLLGVCGGSAVLMTSRKRADAPDPAHRLDLRPLPAQDAVSVVQAFGGERAADAEATSQICTQVGNLPLALRLVGRYLAQQEEEASEYLAWLQQTPLAALDQGRSQRESVRVLLQRSIAQLSVTAQRVLRLVGLLALSPFEGELVGQILELAERETRQALGELVNYGILLRQQSHYEVSHPLLHTYARQELLAQDDPATRRDLSERVVQVLNDRFPPVEFTTWARCEALLPHAQACATFLEEQGLVSLDACNLLNRAGWYLRERGRNVQSSVLLHLGLTFYEQLADETAPGLGSLLNNLALLYREQGLYNQMIAYAERALHYDEQVRGSDDPETAKSIDNLAQLYQAQGKYPEAEPLYQRALAIREQQLGPQHPNTAASLDNLAQLYLAQGKYPEAEPLYQRALAIREQQLGPQHPNTATSLNNLALLYQAQGKYPEAEPLYQRALAIYEQQLGPTHPYTAQSLDNLARLYQNQGKYAEAEPLYQRALAIREQQLGAEHPDTAQSLNNLAALYWDQGKYPEAEPLYQRALAIYEQQLGPQHPDTATSLNNLAGLYQAQGKYAEAEPLYQRALAICEHELGPQHPTTKIVRQNYTSLLQDLSPRNEKH